MQKRGLVSPVFKYIFALIVGGMFILFFASFGMNYLKGSEKVESSRLTIAFDDTLDALSSGTHAVSTYTFGMETAITFIGGKIQSGTGLPVASSKIVFSPTNLKGKQLLIWTKRWELAFPVTNFFYMHNPDRYKYYFIYDASSKDFVEEITNPNYEVPKSFGIYSYALQSFDANALSFGNINRAKFVIFSTSPQAQSLKTKLAGMQKSEVLIIKGEDDWENGILEFETGKTIYLGRAMLFGAIFTESHSDFIFGQQQAFKALTDMANLYLKKTEHMKYTASLQSCSYDTIEQNLKSIKTNAESASKPGAQLTESDMKDFLSAAKALEQANKQFGATCPGIF